jgi:hypothetical protein
MLSNLKIVRLRNFIKITPQGTIDLKAAKEVIIKIASVNDPFSEYDVLIDTRGAESHLSVFEIWEIAKDLAEAVHSGSPKGFNAKIAVICPVERFDYAKFLELCSLNRGLNVQAFTLFEDMFEWLSETSTPG